MLYKKKNKNLLLPAIKSRFSLSETPWERSRLSFAGGHQLWMPSESGMGDVSTSPPCGTASDADLGVHCTCCLSLCELVCAASVELKALFAECPLSPLTHTLFQLPPLLQDLFPDP